MTSVPERHCEGSDSIIEDDADLCLFSETGVWFLSIKFLCTLLMKICTY